MTPEERASVAVAYINAIGWEDGAYGGPESSAGQRLKEAVAAAVREAVAEEREACAQIAAERASDGDPYCCGPLVLDIAAQIRRRTS